MNAEQNIDLKNLVKELAERIESKRTLELKAAAVVAETVEKALIELKTSRGLFDNEKLSGFLRDLDHVIFELKTYKSAIDKDLCKFLQKLDNGQDMAKDMTKGIFEEHQHLSDTTNLNMLQKFEITLTPEQWAKYLHSLFENGCEIPNAVAVDQAIMRETQNERLLGKGFSLWGMYCGFTYTARQRAEALLRALAGEKKKIDDSALSCGSTTPR